MTLDTSRGPSLAVDVVVRFDRNVLLVQRRNAPVGWALPGGFVEEGETVEEAARREIREELSLELDRMQQWRVFSDPERDPRGHVVSVCFKARGRGNPRARTDAATVGSFRVHDPWPDLVFDHRNILDAYVKSEWTPHLRYREDDH